MGIFGLLRPRPRMGPAPAPCPVVLRAEFVYAIELKAHALTQNRVPQPVNLGIAAAAALGVDVVVSLAAKAAESLIDAAAAKTQPSATHLEATVPIDGFYEGDRRIAVDNGCLIVHNGTNSQATDATLFGMFQVHASTDRSAFRLTVLNWRHAGFIGKLETVLQTHRRDVALKVELLAPGNAGLGSRAAFIEHVFPGVDQPALQTLFVAGQALPWLACPPRPTEGADGRCMPLNIQVSYIETSKPNQLALWVQEVAKEKKSDISTLVKDSVRSALDPAFGAAEASKQAEKAGAAFAAYKTQWDELSKLKAAKPVLPATPTAEQQAAHQAALAKWTSDVAVKGTSLKTAKLLAVTAFDTAGLPWAGDLPAIATV